VFFLYTSCLAGNELVPNLTKNTASGLSFLNERLPGKKISQDPWHGFELAVGELEPVDGTGRPQVEPFGNAGLAEGVFADRSLNENSFDLFMSVVPNIW
jgi:hypothetical protein